MARLIHQRPPRHGVLLLLVLALLAMFGLLAISFTMITSHARRGTEALSRAKETADPRSAQSGHSPNKLLNEAIGQVIRGTTNRPSVLGPHSLLDDIYGNASPAPVASPGTISGLALVGNGQMIDVTSTVDASFYVGSVLTVISSASPAYRVSFRIVGYNSGSQTIRILNEGQYPLYGRDGQPGQANADDNNDNTDDDAGEFGWANTDDLVRINDQFIVNGVPFSGTGAGFNPATGRLDLQFTDGSGDPRTWPLAFLLRPFASDLDYQNWLNGPDGNPGTADDPSAALISAMGNQTLNEDYDAVDYQNPLLALMLPNGQVPIPSLHRPDLINYWQTQFASDWSNPDLRRKVILRPTNDDHPNFPPLTDLLTGPWDVDNDGDGVPDSIWVDLGTAVRKAKDGRAYKPMFAILCLDMGGRMNLNAHGSTEQLAGTYSQQVTGNFAGSGSQSNLTLPRGEGYGPGDINLATGLTSGGLSAADVARLLQGDSSSTPGIEGRYGELGGSVASPQAGVTDSADTLASVKLFEYPDDYTDVLTSGNLDTTKLTPFGNPPDLWGRGAFGLDYRGQPFYWRSAWNNEVTNNPYRLNLSRKVPRPALRSGSTVDNPFTPGELERLLRAYDVDAGMLAQRLVLLAPNLVTLRSQVTTDSYDVPTPGRPYPYTQSPIGTPIPVQGARSVVELLRAALNAGSVPANRIDSQIAVMLSWELLANRRMDINRPLGNGGNPSAPGEPEAAWNNLFPPYPSGTVNFDVTNGLASNPLARHYFARQLYVLMLLLMDANYIEPAPNEPGLLPRLAHETELRELTVRRIAQWAVNTVDFRDPDSVMTPFEYDAEPFAWNGTLQAAWKVDGNLSTVETTPDRRVVWGCEAPELLITETAAFHDRRVADTSWDSTGKKRTDDDGNGNPADTDLDQPLIPQGSAFFEVYCPRNPNNTVAPSDLYTYQGSGWSLDLGRMAPASGSASYPVWRMVISESRLPNTGNANNDVLTRANAAPCSTAFEPRQQRGTVGLGFSLLSGGSVPDVQIDRIVWFTTQAPTNNHSDYQRIYYCRNGASPTIPCASYALIGPRPTTVIGGKTTLGEPSDHRIPLNTVGMVDNDGTNNYPDTTNTIKPATGIIVAADPPTGWTNANVRAPNGIGISISEPLPQASYYPEPTEQNPNNSNAWEAYVDLTTGGSATGIDHPFDSAPNGDVNRPPNTGRPLAEETNMTATGTTTNYKTVFLQRLANPNMAYQNDPSQPNYNPYLTVDWSPIDLTVFNGAERVPGSLPSFLTAETWDPDDPNPDATASYSGTNKDEVRFASRQRGPQTYNSGAPANLWSLATSDPPRTAIQNVSTINFRHNFGTTAAGGVVAGGVVGQTIGFVNQGYGIPWRTTDNPAAPSEYRGTPRDTTQVMPRPFPWLTWNDRPYASPMELLLVPSSHPARLCWEFSLADNSDPYNYDPASATAISLPFSHLLNFFHAAGGSGAAQFHRVLEYVQVPSRFVGAETWLNPTNFSAATGPQFFRPPFNYVSNYRDPGKVNINTITSQAVWDAVLNGHAGPTFAQLTDSRRGYAAGANWWDRNNNYPTAFANPFRSGGCGDLVPVMTVGGNADALRKSRPANVSLLRASGTDPDASSAPLFGSAFTAATDDYRNTDRNPSFRYQGLQRLSNLVTTRSNVYAVWITVGYFEAELNLGTGSVDAAHPDGYRLGRELGSDTGEVKRHRAFYMIDRSIPVGFSRGKDYNVGNTILLSRFIE